MGKKTNKRNTLTEESKPVEKTQIEIDHEHQASPSVYIPLSIFAALLLAVGNVTVTVISKYRFRARYMQAPGALIANVVSLVIVSIRDKRNSGGKADPKTGKKETGSYFKWFTDVYFQYHDSKDGKTQKLKIYWPRVIVTLFLGFQSMIQRYLVASGYYYGSEANINNGVLTCVYSMKSIFSSIIFFVMFGQRLLKLELFGILIWVISTVLITLSNVDMESNNFMDSKNIYSYLALLFLFGSVLLVVSRKVLIKYFFAFGDNQLNAPAITCFRNVVFDVFFISFFMYELYYGFEVTWWEVMMGMSGGFIFSVFSYITTFVDGWSKVGVADALIETWVIYQTVFDMLMFDRVPNFRQILGLLFGLLATLLMAFRALFAEKEDKKEKEKQD
jgi:hypothetical protein